MKEHVLRVHYLPSLVAAEELAGSVAVVIDVLRATTTICHALASGAAEVVPFLEVEEALAAAENARSGSVVLGGERAGGKIPGFDLGNSPCEYVPRAVGGRLVFITTTNGTRALHHARSARRVLVGAFVNVSAVVASVEKEPRVDILCAGTEGEETREDILVAGAMVAKLADRTDGQWELSATARAARHEWGQVVRRAEAQDRPLHEQLALELRDTPGGRNLVDIGLDRDLVDCAQIDRLQVVPELDLRRGRIRI